VAHSKSALKRWRQNERHRERNKSVRSGARTAVRNARATIASQGDDEARAAIAEASSILDRASKGNVVHKNAVSRHKSRLMRRLNAAAAPGAVAEAPKRARKSAAKTTKTTAKKTASKPRTVKAKSSS
jgi:small subunit ribosomal protein S20